MERSEDVMEGRESQVDRRLTPQVGIAEATGSQAVCAMAVAANSTVMVEKMADFIFSVVGLFDSVIVVC